VRVSVVRGCLQGGVLPLLLWSLVVEDPLWELNIKGHFTVGYADDIAILINGKSLQTVSEVLQTALCSQESGVKEQISPSTPIKW
jgi:hypothetical protein